MARLPKVKTARLRLLNPCFSALAIALGRRWRNDPVPPVPASIRIARPSWRQRSSIVAGCRCKHIEK